MQRVLLRRRVLLSGLTNMGGGTNWEQRWQTKNTPWDLGTVTPALSEQLDRIPKGATGLVPGCGAAYDLSAIATRCKSVTGVDISGTAIEVAKSKVKEENVDFVLGNFFDYHLFDHHFDFIFDYTFFCAIDMGMREEWGKRMSSLLKPGGKLLTLVFPIDETKAFDLTAEGPPFPVSVAAYEKVLSCHGIRKLSETASEASVSPRREKELVVWWEKPASTKATL